MSVSIVEPELDSAMLSAERAEPAQKLKPWAWLAIVLISALAFAIFRPVGGFAFLNFDDDLYLENNPWLRKGITAESLQWAITANLTHFSMRAEYWSPVTL